MFGKKTAKKMGALAEAQQKQAAQFTQQAATPPPLQSAEDKANLQFLDWENRTGEFAGKPLNVEEAPGMNPYLELYRRSTDPNEVDGAPGELAGGSGGVSPEYLAMLREQAANKRRERAGGALEDAFRQRSAAAHGYVLPSSSLTTQRNLTLSGQASGNANNAWARFLQQQQQSGFFNSAFYKAMRDMSRDAAMAGG
jgi:hypothetical protein